MAIQAGFTPSTQAPYSSPATVLNNATRPT